MSGATPAGAVIEFPDGLPGFEAHRRFVLVSTAALGPFTILQGLGPEAPAFGAVDPRRIVPDYAPALDATDRARLRADDDTPLVWLSLVSIGESGRVTVNLRAPVVINPATLRGIQLVHSGAEYAFDHPLQAA